MQILRSRPSTCRIDADSVGLSSDSAVYDDHLLLRLWDSPLRELCTRAAGLSGESLVRLEAMAETLRRTEGLAPGALTSRW
ncbi:hypothetical protein [Nocardia sp. AG03]|uniref:hypothetical protein n=1 Tax=Nocardia sp. AG03 TaxID=3025312 RepID=UPI0024185B97|nr:hypothetical protein [Nocardia sp. AG03]